MKSREMALPNAVEFQGTSRPPPSMIWDKVWHHEPSEVRDQVLLDRERKHPRWRLMVRELTDTFGSIAGLKTVELGSGRGDLSVLLSQMGADVTLLDSSERALDQARRRFSRLGLPARFERDDLLGTLNRHQTGFDVALSSGVIEHFRGAVRTKAMRAHHKVLKPNGMAMVSVPHAWCLPYRFWKSYCEFRHCWPYGQELPYTKTEMLRRSDQAGFLRPRVFITSFWQSVGDHLGRSILGWGPDWVDRPFLLDCMFGATLLLFANAGGRAADVKPTEHNVDARSCSSDSPMRNRALNSVGIRGCATES